MKLNLLIVERQRVTAEIGEYRIVCRIAASPSCQAWEFVAGIFDGLYIIAPQTAMTVNQGNHKMLLPLKCHEPWWRDLLNKIIEDYRRIPCKSST